jgi:NADH-quinone oxidoreductase subunit L
MTPVQTALLVLLAPLASAVLIALFLGRRGTAASSLSVLASAVVAIGALSLAFGGARFTASTEWLRLGSFSISIGFKYDDLAALMLGIVGVVGLCVHVFSLGYMHDDAARARYFGGLSIFMFSMIGIVLADNLFMMFIFWELVGFSSTSSSTTGMRRSRPPTPRRRPSSSTGWATSGSCSGSSPATG